MRTSRSAVDHQSVGIRVRRHFNQAIGINPIRYRQTFRGSTTDRPLPEPDAVAARARLAAARLPSS